MIVFLIAFLHAVPVLVVGHKSKSRIWAVSTAIFMAIVGVATGNPAYMAADIVAVGLALCFVYATTNAPANKPDGGPVSGQATGTSSRSGTGIWGFFFWAIVVFIGYSFFENSSQNKSMSQASQPTIPIIPELPQPPITPAINGAQSPLVPLPNSASSPASYSDVLQSVEAKYPALNPDHPDYREDLMERVVSRVAEYKQRGNSPTRALLLAIEDMEHGASPVSAPPQPTYSPPIAINQNPTTKPRKRTSERTCEYKGVMSDEDYRACGLNPPGNKPLEAVRPPVPPEAYVFDKGGHPGYPQNCRWLSQYEWSCK